MAQIGSQVWNSIFRGKGNVKTVMKKESNLLDMDGKIVGKIKAGAKITVVETERYESKQPILYRKKPYRVSFNNIQKPAGQRISKIVLKPQSFKTLKSASSFSPEGLARGLISEVEDRKDLPADLKTYIVELTKYWAKLPGGDKRKVKQVYSPDIEGINEVQKDYGEMLGAIACVNHRLIQPPHNLSTTSKLIFPRRGDEPIVDYYIRKDSRISLNVSAKTTSATTNTLKTADILMLLNKKGLDNRWKNKPIYKMFELITEKSVMHFPFFAMNALFSRKILSTKTLREVEKYSAAKMTSKDFSPELLSLLEYISIPGNPEEPTFGEMFYYTEKHILETINQKYGRDLTKIFEDATSGLIIYVKYGITRSNPAGSFDVDIDDQQEKRYVRSIKMRSKNGIKRAQDKLGLQP